MSTRQFASRATLAILVLLALPATSMHASADASDRARTSMRANMSAAPASFAEANNIYHGVYGAQVSVTTSTRPNVTLAPASFADANSYYYVHAAQLGSKPSKAQPAVSRRYSGYFDYQRARQSALSR